MKAWMKWVLALALLLLIGLFWRGLQSNPRHIPSVLLGHPAAGFTAAALDDGREIKLDQYRGKVLLLNFWASWCIECAAEHATLLKLARDYQSNPDFAMLGVVYQDQPEDARAFLQKKGSAFPSVIDAKGQIGIDYGVYGVPETFLIDRQGKIICKQFGPITGAEETKVRKRWLDTLLAGKELKSCE